MEGGPAVQAAADHHAGHGDLNGCAAVPAETSLTVPVLPRGSFLGPVLCGAKTRRQELLSEGMRMATDPPCPYIVSRQEVLTCTPGGNEAVRKRLSAPYSHMSPLMPMVQRSLVAALIQIKVFTP